MAGKSDGSNSSLRGAIATKQSTLVLSCGELDCFAGARNDGIRASPSRNPSPAVSEHDGYRLAPPILRAATGQDLGNGLICVGQISSSCRPRMPTTPTRWQHVSLPMRRSGTKGAPEGA